MPPTAPWDTRVEDGGSRPRDEVSRYPVHGHPKARSIGGLRDDTLVERLRHAVVDVDAGLRVREGGLEPIDLSLADGQPTLEEGPVD